LRVPWHRGIAAQTAFAAPRERVALPMLGCPLRVHRVDADSAARHAKAEGNVCWNPPRDAATLSLFEHGDTLERMRQGSGAAD